MNKPLEIVLLAAGRSQRFGRDKRSEPFADSTILQSCLALALSTGLEVKLVLAAADRKQEELAGQFSGHPKLELIYAQQARSGMGHSLASGIGQLGNCSGAIIMLADMPWIKAKTLQQLIGTFDGKAIIVPDCQGTTGHPVIFPSSCFAELAQLSGDHGGKTVIQRHLDLLQLVAVDDAGVLRDIDTPCDLEKTADQAPN